MYHGMLVQGKDVGILVEFGGGWVELGGLENKFGKLKINWILPRLSIAYRSKVDNISTQTTSNTHSPRQSIQKKCPKSPFETLSFLNYG
ncbi:hypothetical protein [Rossellomorea aquimaris]|uniref:Uncharacterized protein n=1 Tax=Rossellomorea aquimaris TaxID=189382 RepID=A0A5D4UPQ9_9BACI|nr:hypothetical protein [Rossellomorea aquimaris]TYS88749.1 hypothetical protein FZC85_04905 [Rossellomorea aquimaris]